MRRKSALVLGSGDKERAGLVKSEEALEVEVGAVHHVNRCGFGNQQIEHVDIVQLAVGNMYETRDIAAQIEQGMHLDRSLGASKTKPTETTTGTGRMVVESSA